MSLIQISCCVIKLIWTQFICSIIIGVLVGLAIIATTYDVVIQHMSKPKKNSWDLADGHATTYDSAGNGHVNNGYDGEKNGPISDLSGQEHKYQFKEPDRSMSVEEPSTTQYKPGKLYSLVPSIPSFEGFFSGGGGWWEGGMFCSRL